MDPLNKRLLYSILVLAAVFILIALFSCSPQARLSKILRKNPHLINTKIDTVFVETDIEEIPIHIFSDTIRFDSLLIEYYTLREEYYEATNKGFVDGENVKITQLETVVNLLKKELRKGALVETSGFYASEDSTISFNFLFDPGGHKKMSLTNIKKKDKIITVEKTVKINPTTKDAFTKLWWVWSIMVILFIAVILSKIF